jgi:hypothetical protein
VYAVSGVLRHTELGTMIWVDALLLAPSLLVFGVALLQREGRPAQRWTKAGMVLALAGLFVMGIF